MAKKHHKIPNVASKQKHLINDKVALVKGVEDESQPHFTISYKHYIGMKYYQKENEKNKEEEDKGPFFPPPWNINEHPEKTEGWIEFQRARRKDPNYYE